MDKPEEQPDDLDFDLLEKILDYLDAGHTNPDVQQPSHAILSQVKFERDPDLHSALLQQIHSTFWADPPEDLRSRIEICIKCKDINCIHLKQADDDIEQFGGCHHQISWRINGICGKCIIDENHPISPERETIKLWDSTDLVTYVEWISSFSNNN